MITVCVFIKFIGKAEDLRTKCALDFVDDRRWDAVDDSVILSTVIDETCNIINVGKSLTDLFRNKKSGLFFLYRIK